MPRFPTRTLILMSLALFAFAWMYWQMHNAKPARTAMPANVEWIDLTDGGAK